MDKGKIFGLIISTILFIALISNMYSVLLKLIYTPTYAFSSLTMFWSLGYSLGIILIIKYLGMLDKFNYYFWRFISRLSLIFMGAFFSFVFITKNLSEKIKTENIELPKFFDIKTFQIAGWEIWFILFILITFGGMFIYNIF